MREWKIYKLKGFDDLLDAMESCESNGDLPHSVKEAYEALDVGNITSTYPDPNVNALIAGVKAWLDDEYSGNPSDYVDRMTLAFNAIEAASASKEDGK